MIYFDNATETKGNGESVFGEITSAYGVMHALDKLYDEKEACLRALFNMVPEDAFFITASWEEVPKTIVRSNSKKKVAVSLSDTQATLSACDEARTRCEVTYLKDSEAVQDSLLFVQYVHPLTGVMYPLINIDAAKEQGCSLAVDVSYALGKVPLDHVLERADYIMVRGAALGVPFGLSLVASRKNFLDRQQVSLSALNSFLVSVEKAFSQELFFATEVARWKNIFEQGERVVFSEKERAPHISCVEFPGVKNELLLFTLAKRNLFATIGGGPFTILENMNALSFCFGEGIEESDVFEAKTRLKRAVKELQVISEGVL